LVLRGEAFIAALHTLRPAVVFGLIENAVFAREPVFAEEHQVMG
jgi:hypothetical protein